MCDCNATGSREILWRAIIFLIVGGRGTNIGYGT
jgi:hypothetical protein